MGQVLPSIVLVGGHLAPTYPRARRVGRRPFVPDVLTGILVVFQGFSELLGSPPKWNLLFRAKETVLGVEFEVLARFRELK